MWRSARSIGLLAGLFIVASASAATAQTRASSTCPVSTRLLQQAVDTTAQALSQLIRGTRDIDTTYAIAIGDRRWERASFSTGLNLGAVGEQWLVCAGVSVTTGRVQLHMVNVRGRVRQKISFTEFRSQIGRGQ